MLGCYLNLMAQEGDSTSLRPSFGVDYTGEVQTDFKQVRQVNLLQLHADIPLSRKFSFQAASISTLFTKKELEIVELQGYSNIEAYIKIPFAFTVAGITLQRKGILRFHGTFQHLPHLSQERWTICHRASGIQPSRHSLLHWRQLAHPT